MYRACNISGRKILFHQRYNWSLLKVGTEIKENVNVAPLYMDCDIRKITYFPPSNPHPPQIHRPPFTQSISSNILVMNFGKKDDRVQIQQGQRDVYVRSGHLMFIKIN